MVLGAAAPKGLGRSPYKICELGLSSLKASKILEFLDNSRIPRINLEFLDNSRIPKDKFRIPRDCFASLAMTQGILEFLLLEILGSSPRMT